MADKNEHRFKVEVRAGVTISAIRTGAARDAPWTYIYAPGAGANINDPFGAHLAATLPAGVALVRFQFPYMEAGRRGPDTPDVLETAWRAVIDAVRKDATKLAAGGRSMGGRIASMVHASGVTLDALALFAYPLHPPGKSQQRTEHFGAIKAPTLFVSGTNDAFASPDELGAAAALVKRSSVHLLDGADHGFAVKKASGRTKQDVWDEASDAFLQFLKR